jgi:hypothetical protein
VFDRGSALAVFLLAAALWPSLALWIVRRLARR